MAYRSYMLIALQTELVREDKVAVVRALEAMPEVLFAEPVVGAFDVVATLETEGAVEDAVRRIQALERVAAVQPLKVDPIPVRERMWRNFDRIPVRPGS